MSTTSTIWAAVMPLEVMGRWTSLRNLRNSSGESGLQAFNWVVLILVSGRGRGWRAHRLWGSAAATGDVDSRMLSWLSKGSVGGFSSSEACPSRLWLRSTPRRLPLSGSLHGDSAGEVAGGTRRGEGSGNADADVFACFALMSTGRVIV